MKLLTELKIFVETTKLLVNHASLSALYKEDREAMSKIVAQGESLIARLAAMEYAAPTLAETMREHEVMAAEIRRILGNLDLLPEQKQPAA